MYSNREKDMIYVDQEIIDAVQSSYSIREVLTKLGRNYSGGNFSHIKKKIIALNCSMDHFNGRGWSIGRTLGPKRNIEEYLNNEVFLKSHDLRRRLIKEGLKEHRCEVCKLAQWNDQLIPIELHHINGDIQDNSLSNLQILCLNCHAQTPNFRIKNKRVR